MLKQTIYKIPLEKNIINQIHSLEKFDFDNCYCDALYIGDICDNKDLYLVSVYDMFGGDEDLNINKKQNLLFGRILSEKFSTRSKNKFIKIKEVDIKNIDKNSLPFLRYNSSLSGDINGNWFFVEPCEYYILGAKKSNFEAVNHLETLSIYSEPIIKLRIIIELLKKNKKKGIITNVDFYEVAFFYLSNEGSFKNIGSVELKAGIKNWVNEITMTPIYDDILASKREKINTI